MRIIGKDVDATREATIVASGTLPNGKPVVVNADGTVSVVSGVAQSIGSSVVFEAATTRYVAAVFDSNSNKVVVVYRDNGNSEFGTAIVGTVSGTSINFGSPATFGTSFGADYISATFDSNSNKVVVAYANSGNSLYGTAVVGTVSGTSISFGTPVVFNSSGTDEIGTTFDSNSNKVVIAYRDSGNFSYGTAIVGTVSGTSISFGSESVFESANSSFISAVFDSSNNKVVISYRDIGNSSYGTAVVGTVSGTSISFGTPVVFKNSSVAPFAVFDSNSNKVVIGYADGSNSNYGTAIVGTVSGTSISFGSAVVIYQGTADGFKGAFDSNANKVIFTFKENGATVYGVIVPVQVSGSTVSAEPAVTFFNGTHSSLYTVFDSNSNKTVINYTDNGNSQYGNSIVFQAGSTNLTAENYIGISDGDIDTITQSESVGTPSVYATTEALQSDLAYDSASGKMVLAWRDSNNTNGHGKAVVITVSGTTLSYGTPVTFNAASTRIPKVVFDSANNKIVIAYRNDGNNNYSTAIVGTVSGTSISFGTPVVWKSANNSGIGATYDPDNSKVIVGSAGTGAGAYEVFVGTVSGTSISFGSSSGSLGTAYSGELAYDEANNKVIAALHMYPSTGSTFVGTVSGTSISFGSANNITTSGFSDIWGLVYDSANSKMVICYQANGLYSIVGTVSGTTMTFGSATNVQAASNDADIVYDSLLNKPIVAFKDVGNTNNGTVKVGTSINPA